MTKEQAAYRNIQQNTPPPSLLFAVFCHQFFDHYGPPGSFVLQGFVCPYWNPRFYHVMDPPLLYVYINAHLPCRRGTDDAKDAGKALDLLVMLGMLAGHVGDVENDADDVDGLA